MKTKVLLLTALVSLSFLFANAQRGVRIGYIDTEYILQNVDEYQEAYGQLNEKVQRWKSDIEKKKGKIDQMRKDLSTEKVLLTTELIEDRLEDIEILETELSKYQQDRFGPKGDYIIQQGQLIKPLQDQIFTYVREMAVAKKLDFVFDKSADVVMLYADTRYDISDLILRKINRDEKIEDRKIEIEEKTEQRKQDLETRKEKIEADRQKKLDEREQKRKEYEERRKKLLEEREALKNKKTNNVPEGGTPEE